MQAGQTVTHYKLQKRLGAGGMGEVWLADDTRLDQRVAIKFISPLLGTNREAQERFLREARAAARLRDHPHVVPVYELGDTEGSTFIVMGYIQGESLREVIEREGKTIPLLDCLRWGKGIAEGLGAAHAEGITHRDIKPDNVLLDGKRQVRIADFGLARLASSTQLTQTGAGMGTLKYMSPEQATGKNVDHRTDLFSLGATLYELLAGEPAFRGDDPPALIYAVAHTEPVPLGELRPDLPAPLVDLVKGLLRKNPDQRPQSAEVVSRELAKMMEALSRGEAVPPLALETPPIDATVPIPDAGLAVAPVTGGKAWWRARFFQIGAGVAALAVLGWGAVQVLDRGSSTGDVARSDADGQERKLLILPFAFSGDPGLAHYARDVVSGLDFVLQGTGDFTIVKTDSVLEYLDAEGIDTPRQTAMLDLAATFGASHVITGSLSTIGSGLQINAEVLDHRGAVLKSTLDRVTNQADFQALMDRVGLGLLEGMLDGLDRELQLAAINDAESLEALKAFFRGLTHNQRWEFDQALTQFEAAAEDSGFALANLKYSKEIYWDTEMKDRALNLAKRAHQARHDLPLPFQNMVEAWYEELNGNVNRAEQLLRTVLLANADLTEANLQLANLLWDYNPARGRSGTECIPFLERVLEANPHYPGPFFVLRFAYFMDDDMEAMDHLLRLFYGGSYHNYWRYLMACAGDDRELQDALADSLRLATDLNTVGRSGRTYGTLMISVAPDNHRNLLAHYDRLPDSLQTPVEILLNDMTRGYLEAGLGRWEKACEWFDSISSDYALHITEHKALLMAAPVLEIPEPEIREMIETLRTWPKDDRGIIRDMEASDIAYSRFQPHFEIHPHIRIYLLALLHARIGEFDSARSWARQLDSAETLPDWSVAIENLRTGTWATIAYMEGDYQEALDRLDALENKMPRSKYALFGNRTWEIFLRALVLSRLGRGEEALPWFQQQPNEFGFALVAPAHLERARIYDELGEVDDAMDYYTRFIDLWRDADPALQPQVEEARQRLAALSS